MLAEQLFKFLTRAEVKEIALHTGRPPCALVDDAYRRLSSSLLREDDVIGVLAAAQGQPHLTQLADGRSWEFDAPGVGVIVVSAVYDQQGLKAMLRLRDRPGDAPAPRAPSQKRPSRAPRPKRNSVAPKRNSTAPKRPSGAPARRSRRPPPPPPQTAVDIVEAPTQTLGAHLPPAKRAPSRPQSRPQSEGVSLPPPAPDDGDGFLEGTGMSLPAAPFTRSSSRPDFQPPVRQARHEAPATSGRPLSRQDLHAVPGGRSELLGLSMPPAARPPSRPLVPVFQGDALDDLLRLSLELRASDLHIVAERPPLFRVAGDLVPQGSPLGAALVDELVLPRVPVAKRGELDLSGSCDFALSHPAYGRFRANVSRQRTGLKMTCRPIGAAVPTLEDLGLPQAMRKALNHHQGLIVVTGPTGHGKTTTMAALVGIVNRETTHHVITVEDPIEYVHPTAKAVISQREVGTHTKTFQAALKASLREDPDVIVVGELRDTETVRMALSASETGHLVISTMNTPSAAKAIERLIDLFPPGDQPQVRMTLAGGLRLITSQRLLPTADRRGMCAAAELLPGNTALWSLIRDNRTYQITSLQQRGKSLGIVRLDDSLAELVRSGRTTIDIAREYAEAPNQFDALVAGRPINPQPEAAAPVDDGAAAAAAKRGIDLGKQVLSRAGKLFGNETK